MLVTKPGSSSPSARIPTYTVAQVITEQLDLWGVKRIYGVVGDAIFGLIDALAQQKKIEFIAVKHESAAALMASAEAKITGTLGVCVAQMGPGLANLINGLGDAFLDQAPVLVITGQAPTPKIGTDYKQYINQQKMMQSLSVYSQLAVHPAALVNSLTVAMHTALVKSSVSHLSIPSDLFFMTTSTPPRKPIPLPTLDVNSDTIDQALQLLRSAQHPLLLIGNSMNVRTASAEIQLLAETWGSGIALSYGSKGVIPDSFPLLLGGLGEGGNPYLDNLFPQADVVLILETSWWPQGLVPTNARIVQIDSHMLNFGKSTAVDSTLSGNLQLIIPQLISGLRNHASDPGWLSQIEQCKHAWSQLIEAEAKQDITPLHPASIMHTIAQTIAADAVITLDTGNVTLWFLRNFRPQQQLVLLSEHWRTMGFGLPAAIAAKLIMPERQVICLTGDGGLCMVLADLLTAVRYRLPLILLVFNNGTLQMEKDKLLMQGLIPIGTEITNPDFTKLAEACGWRAYRAETNKQLADLLKQSPTYRQPLLINIPTANVPHPDNNPQ
jgi:pyruvate oxidase